MSDREPIVNQPDHEKQPGRDERIGNSGGMSVADAFAGMPWDDHAFSPTVGGWIVTGIEKVSDTFYLLHNPDYRDGVLARGSDMLWYERIGIGGGYGYAPNPAPQPAPDGIAAALRYEPLDVETELVYMRSRRIITARDCYQAETLFQCQIAAARTDQERAEISAQWMAQLWALKAVSNAV